MKVEIVPVKDGSYWIVTHKGKTEWHGPFACVLDASIVVCEMVADRAKEIHGNNVYFLEGRWKV